MTATQRKTPAKTTPAKAPTKPKAKASDDTPTLDLLPDAPPEGVFSLVFLEDIPRDDLAAAPSKALVENIRALGILQPILLREVQQNIQYVQEEPCVFRYEIIAGRRRILAARELNLGSVPAIVYPEGTDCGAIMCLSENAVRESNPIAELYTIEQLLKRGSNESDIAKATGMAVGTIRMRKKLLALPPIIREGMTEGSVSVAVAQNIASLPRAIQCEIAQVHQEKVQKGAKEKKGELVRLTANDVKEVRQVSTSAAIDALPDELFPEIAPEDRAKPVLTITAPDTESSARSVVEEGTITIVLRGQDAAALLHLQGLASDLNAADLVGMILMTRALQCGFVRDEPEKEGESDHADPKTTSTSGSPPVLTFSDAAAPKPRRKSAASPAAPAANAFPKQRARAAGKL